MGRITSTLTAVCAATLLTAATTSAQPADRETVVTVSGPVSIPGATLPAGSYVFRLADSPANRHIVQIFDRDRAKLITTLLAVPAERAEAQGDSLITFKETPANRPPAVRYWYYAGEKSGNEFVYPKAQAMMIARASGESVSSVNTDATDIEGWKKGEVSRVTPTAKTTAPTAQPEPTPPATAAPATPKPAPSVGTSGRSKTLPRTASQTPMVGLVGFLALAGAFAVRAARRSLT